MIYVESIYETEKIVKFLEKRWLLDQYKSAKKKILEASTWKTYFKLMKPKEKKDIVSGSINNLEHFVN